MVKSAKEQPVSEKDETAEQSASAENVPATAEGASPAAETGSEQAATQKPKEEDPDDKLITLEEYTKGLKRAKVSLPRRRAAGEGVELDAKWANAVPLKREEAEELVVLKDKAAKKKEAKKEAPAAASAKKETKISAAKLIKFDTGRDRRRGGDRAERGGRGGGRGGARTGDRRPGPAQQPPKKYQPERSDAPQFDESAFPALCPSAAAVVSASPKDQEQQ